MNPDLSVAPYFDDYDDSKNFSKVLYRPDRAVQARELNQTQTILQKQIARFGDNIFKQGSVVSGCHVTSIDQLPYVKLNNLATSGARADVTAYKQLYVKNAANTVGTILDTAVGFENRAPDLNTLFVRYINSGNDGVSPTFNAGETLTVYNPLYSIEDVTIVNGSSGFTNRDPIYFIPAVAVTNTSGGNTFAGGLYVGDIISNGSGANVVISSISGGVLTLKPTATDLGAANSAAWSIAAGTYTDANTGQAIVVANVFGSAASGYVTTNGNGTIIDATVTSSGSGYSVIPTAVVGSASASSVQQGQLSITAKNFVEQVTVAGAGKSPIGVGFGVTVDEGVIYQNESFTRTDRQFVVVSKYSATPSDVVVGFISTEEIVSFIEDSSLNDNSAGFPNESAPGADRLRITAQVSVLTANEAASRTDFVSLVEFSEGQPFKTNDSSSYNAIADAIAQRTYEQAGNFVTDPFLVNIKSASIANEPTTTNVVVDPGTAYISGYRVSTDRNYVMSINKATTTKVVASVPTNVNYGNYIICDTLIGVPTIDTVVQLFDQRSNPAIGGGPTANGNGVGYARIRGFKKVGTKYYVYLYDINVLSGRAFAQTKSLYDITNTAFVFNVDATAGALVNLPDINRSIFPLAASAVKHVSNLSYTYQKTSWGTVTANSTGFVSLTVTTPEYFPVAGPVSTAALSQIFVVPSANIVASTPLTGTVSTTAASNTITGSGTALSSLAPSTYISVGNSTSNAIVQVVAVANDTSITVSPAPTTTYASVNAAIALVKNIPATVASANVSTDRSSMVINLGGNIPSTNVNIIANVTTSPTLASKTVTRNAVARINLSTNTAGLIGPWCLGHSDVIRLSAVYAGSNTTFTSASANIVDVTNDFYIDSNQTPEATGLGYLYQKVKPRNTLTTGTRLLVVFDVLSSSSTATRVVDSYPISDGIALPSLAANINTVELPEVYGAQQYYDTRDSIDFRPFQQSTITLQTAQSTAPINPAEPAYTSKFAALTRFPAPDTTATADVEYYLGRNDLVVAMSNGSLTTITGEPGSGAFPKQPNQSITINKLIVPPYPSLPAALSAEMAILVDTNIANDKFAGRRNALYSISTTYTAAQINEQQPKRYRMVDIGSLDRRMSAVEYSLALSLAESQTSTRNITSANSPTTDRFKFGFFTDNFIDDSRVDTANPQFNATIVNGVAQPKTMEYVIELEPQNADTASNGVVSIPYTSAPLIAQLGSTDGAYVPVPVVTDPPVGPIPGEPEVIPTQPNNNGQVTVIEQRITTFTDTAHSNVRSTSGNVWIDYPFTLSATDGPIKLMFNGYQNQYAIEVYQSPDPNWVPPYGTTSQYLVKDTTAVVDWTSADYAMYGPGAPVDLNFDYGFGPIVRSRFLHMHGDYPNTRPVAEGTYKIEWDHVAANGRYYFFRLIKYQGTGAKGAKGSYRFAFVYPADFETKISVPNIPLSLEYNGKFSKVDPNVFSVGSYTDASAQQFYTPPQTFAFTVNGLKPSTRHFVTFDNVDYTAKCQPVGKAVGQPLVSGADGSLAFTLYFDGNTANGLTIYQQQNAIANLLAGSRTITVSDTVKSFAATIINPKSYVQYPYGSSGGSGDGEPQINEYGSLVGDYLNDFLPYSGKLSGSF